MWANVHTEATHHSPFYLSQFDPELTVQSPSLCCIFSMCGQIKQHLSRKSTFVYNLSTVASQFVSSHLSWPDATPTFRLYFIICIGLTGGQSLLQLKQGNSSATDYGLCFWVLVVECIYRIYPLSELENKAMQKYIVEALELGLISRSMSPTSTGFFFVRKKDGRLRQCIDFWGSRRSMHPLPLVPSAIELLIS